jgi:SRSO17 transposase
MPTSSDRTRRFQQYVAQLATALAHRDRHEPVRAYLTGLYLPGERKSVEPLAARVDPRRVRARHQSLHHFVANATWDDAAVLRVARDTVLTAMRAHGGVGAWIVDDTGFPKKGRHSVGVARQYCGVLGKQDNCQVAVSVSLANATVSVPAAYQLYLPESWASDRARCRRAKVPDAIAFQPKWQLALALIDRLRADAVPAAPVVADAGYGVVTAFREALTARAIPYMVGISKETTVWRPGQGPLPPPRYRGQGRPPTAVRRTARHRPLAVATLAAAVPAAAWHTVAWRAGTRGPMRSRFTWLRVRPAHRDESRSAPRPVEWLLIEWPRGAAAPSHYWLSTLPATTAPRALVRVAQLRWRVERDYQELKDELGLDHFEGRGWRGFHHHGSLCIAAYAFLAAERARHSPLTPRPLVRAPRVPAAFRPRGAPGAA